MCGIIGYVGSREAKPILLAGLEALEYRGYDSAGIYVPGNGVTKSVGAVAHLIERVGQKNKGGVSGIAHTRWATHGPPTEENAHPHHDEREQVYLVHNGIIENYRELRDELVAKGVNFYSDTDTEVLAQYIGSLLDDSLNLETAVRKALERVRGTYGIAVMRAGSPGEIVAARMGSPLVIGIAPHGHLIASDPSALLAHTKDVVYLEDGQYAVVTAGGLKVADRTGVREPKVEAIEWDAEEATRGGYPHFMLKEIMEGPDVIRNTMRGRLVRDLGDVKLGGLADVRDQLASAAQIQIVGCGSAYYAGLVGKYLLEKYARIPVHVDIASEYRYRDAGIPTGTVVIAVSQSGETADTLASLRLAREQGALALGIVNVVGSTIARETDAGVYNHAGPEVGVASTKAFLSQVTVFAMLAVHIGRMRGMTKEEGQDIIRALTLLPDHIQEVLDARDHIFATAQLYKDMRDFLYIGRGALSAIALEGALKLKEISYVHAEGYGAGEMKHGPIAMIDPAFPTVALAPLDRLYEKNVSNIEEIRARKGPVIAVTTKGNDTTRSLADDVLFVPEAHEVTMPVIATVPLQLFAYAIGVAKGYNVDRPRNLAKSVTVE